MADFSALKTAIQTYIKQNGNEEITGEILQEILLSVVTTLGDTAINNLVTALADEVAARQNADVTLQQNITNEATARGNADTALQGLIDGITGNIENGYVYAGIATPSSTPATGKVFYLALTAGTYTNFGNTEVSQGINILKYNGSAWSLDTFIGIDDTPTPSSNNLIKSSGVFNDIMINGSAFDLSAYNNGTTYADLNAALTALNALPASYKKGGMSIKFVQTSDNKYVQYRLMNQNWSTVVTDWQGVDDKLTTDSHNLAESGDIKDSIVKAGTVLTIDDAEVYQVFPNSEVEDANGTRLRVIYKVNKGALISIGCGLGQGVACAIYSSKSDAVQAKTSAALQLFRNGIFFSNINGVALYDGYFGTTLAKDDLSSPFTSEEKSAFIAATYVSIINGGNRKLTDILESNSNNIHADGGKGLTYISRIINLKSGHTYRIDIPHDWNVENDGTAKAKFSIDKYVGSNTTSSLGKTLSENVKGSYIFTAETADFYTIGYRANNNQAVDIGIYEVVDGAYEVGSVLNDFEHYDAINIGFYGADDIYQTGSRLYVEPNTEYEFTVENPDYPIPSVTVGFAVFEIKEYSSNGTLIRKDVEISKSAETDTIPSSGMFKTASNASYIKIGGRCVSGNIVNVRVKKISALNLSKTLADAQIYRVPTGATSPKFSGNRIRAIFYIDYLPAKISASCSLGKGVAVAVHDTMMNAFNSGVSGRKEIIQYEYVSSITDVPINQKGYLTVMLCKDDGSDFTDAEMSQYLAATQIKITSFISDDVEKEKYLREKANHSVCGLNRDMDDSISSISAYNFYYGGAADYDLPQTRKENFSLGIISDIHGTPESIQRFVEYMNEKEGYFDYNVCLGDIVQRDTIDNVDWFNAAITNSVNPFLFVVGNHDVGQTVLNSISESTARGRYYSTIENKGWLSNSNFIGNNKCSWYKDNSTYKIRLIGLFEYGSCADLVTNAPFTNSRRWYDSETLQWFANILYSTPSDYSVIVMTHLMPTSDYIVENSKFSITEGLVRNNGIFQRWEADGMDGTGAMNNINGNPLPEIVNAFINGTSIEKTYNSITGYFSPQKSATVSKDYSERGEGKFICFINGHVHGSYICNPREYPNQKIVCVPSGSVSPFQRGYDDTPMVQEDRTMDCFYCVGFDTTMKRINIAKIGAQVSIDMIKRDYISIPY